MATTDPAPTTIDGTHLMLKEDLAEPKADGLKREQVIEAGLKVEREDN